MRHPTRPRLPAGIGGVLLLAATACTIAQVNMKPTDPILPAQRFREVAGKAASGSLPDEIAETLPVLTESGGGPLVIVVFYKETGPPFRRTVHPPGHLAQMHPSTGQLIRFARCRPQDLGIDVPPQPVPGVGIDPAMSVDDFAVKRNRFLEISPAVWRLFLSRAAGAPDAASRELVREYWSLFSRITKADVAPFYIGAARDFFTWVRTTAAAEAR